jgi:hypothetical protein
MKEKVIGPCYIVMFVNVNQAAAAKSYEERRAPPPGPAYSFPSFNEAVTT